MDVPTFRTIFPELGDLGLYPDATVSYWIGIGTAMVNPQRWGTLTDYGIALFTAHNLVFSGQAVRDACAGAVPGSNAGGPVSSKTVDKVSVTYNTTLGQEPDSGSFALTSYGSRFIRLLRQMGMGGMQFNGGNYIQTQGYYQGYPGSYFGSY